MTFAPRPHGGNNRNSRISRRRLLAGSAAAGLGAAAIGLVGCGDDDDDAADADSGSVETTPAPASDDAREDPTAGPDSDPAPEVEPPLQEDPPPADDLQATGGPGTWTLLAPTNDAPPARRNPVLLLDRDAGLLYMHGGRSGSQPFGDLWLFDLATNEWTELAAETRPDPRFSHVGVFDALRGRLVVSTGEGEDGFFSDVWAWDIAAGGWTQLAADESGPASRYGTGFDYDPAGDRFLLSHGFTRSGRFDDTWSFDLSGNTWAELSPAAGRPGERCLHTSAYDAGSETFLLFGGQDNNNFQLGDTWLFQDRAWHEVTGPAPSARRFSATKALDGTVWLWGGVGADGRTDDLWAFDIASESWSQQPAADGPAARESHAVAIDPGARLLYLFGGFDIADDQTNDLWMLELPA